MSDKYCCNCGARDEESAKEKALRGAGPISLSGEYPNGRFIVRRAQHDYLCQFCSHNPNYRHHYSETTGQPLNQV